MRKVICFLSPLTGEALRDVSAFFEQSDLMVVTDLEGVRTAARSGAKILISMGSGTVIPADDLKHFTAAYNLHAASPDFPGRDPHHHAVFAGVRRYGATLHMMTKRVDAGPIIAVDRFDVDDGMTPQDLLAYANAAALRLLSQWAGSIEDGTIRPDPDLNWSGPVSRRSDLIALSEVTPLMTDDSVARRIRAFHQPDYDNLWTRIGTQIFSLRPREPSASRTNRFQQFTEAGFEALIVQLKMAGYRFASYGNRADDRHVLWRHDVDFSVHRAVALAEIEARHGVTATYFVNPRCVYYNLLEADIGRCVARIRALGHDIGLHFDAPLTFGEIWTAARLEASVDHERRLLEMMIEGPIAAMSWHNPDQSNLLDFTSDTIGGLHNAYSQTLRRDYAYCSDSNGYWRFTPMQDVIAAGHERLHLLTHPAWWTPEALSPSQRIDRAILGRARAVRRDYDALLSAANRKNIDR